MNTFIFRTVWNRGKVGYGFDGSHDCHPAEALEFSSELIYFFPVDALEMVLKKNFSSQVRAR